MAKLPGREEYPFYYGASYELLGIAYDLRNSMTEAEKALWQKLRRRQVKGYKFRRQHPIKDFVVDFFCYDAKLVVEVDGGVHDNSTQGERDKERTAILKTLGLKELRFRNEKVLNDIDDVINKISEELN